MISSKGSIIGNVSLKGNITGTLNKAVEYVEPITQEKMITPSEEIQIVEPDENYTGLSKVIVNSVTSEIDTNIQPQNIIEGINILGVEGTYSGINPSGQIEITENGNYNVREFESANVNVQAERFEINNASYLFYKNSRTNALNELLSLCKNVTSMEYMFSYCNQLTSLDVSNIDTSNVTNMSNMFRACSTLTTLDVSSFNTSNVRNMERMFNNCSQLTRLDLSNFDTSRVTANSNMLASCDQLVTLIINKQDVFKMSNSNMLSFTPIANGTGYVYVPDNMVDAYRSSTNWSQYSEQIKPISELPAEE